MSILGKWNLTVNTPMGEQAAVLILNEDGTGETSSQMGTARFSNAVVDGEVATFTVSIKVMGMEMDLMANAVAVNDSISGAYEGTMGVSEFTGKRAT